MENKEELNNIIKLFSETKDDYVLDNIINNSLSDNSINDIIKTKLTFAEKCVNSLIENLNPNNNFMPVYYSSRDIGNDLFTSIINSFIDESECIYDFQISSVKSQEEANYASKILEVLNDLNTILRDCNEISNFKKSLIMLKNKCYSIK